MLPNGVNRYAVMQLFDIENPWLPWVEFVLLIVLLMINIIQPHALLQSIRAISSPIQRRYTPGSGHPLKIVLSQLFILCTMSIALLIATTSHEGYTVPLVGTDLLIVTGIFITANIIKFLLEKWIQLTFRFQVGEQAFREYRSEFWLLMSMMMWLFILFNPLMSTTAMWILPCSVFALYFGILWWKMMQLFGWSIQHFIFILVYMLHVEILPILAVVTGINAIIVQKELFYA